MSVFNQLCVWPATTLGSNTPQDLVDLFQNEFNIRIQFEQEVITNPDLDEDGNEIEGTGGRNDLFFRVHDEDVMKFAVPRLQIGIRWWEDVLNNGNEVLYPQETLDKYPKTW